MKKTTNAIIPYLAAMLVFCALIPHGILCLLNMEAVSAWLAPVEKESYRNFFVCQWIPFWLVFLSYLRLQKQDRFSLIPVLCAAAVLLTVLPRFPRRSVIAMVPVIPLVLAMELSGFMKKAESSAYAFFRCLAADRGILRAFYFWSLVTLAVSFISCEACTWEVTVVSPFLLLPVPGILLFAVFRHQKANPPTLWGVVSMLPAIPLSLYLVTVGPMAKFQMYHLMSLTMGYAVLFVMLAVYNIDRWKK